MEFENKRESKNEESNIYSEENKSSFFKLFCQDCLQIPLYQIEIDEQKNILLVHQCNKESKKKMCYL